MTNSTISATMQIENLGPMDNYLFGKDPETDYSLFTYSASRIAPFSKNIVPINFTESVNFGKILTATFPYVGDLVNSVNLHIRLPPLDIPTGSSYVSWTNAVGYAMIEYVEILLGEFVISRQTGELMEILDYMSTPESKRKSKDAATGRVDAINVLPKSAETSQDIYVPLQFWFNKKLNSSIPITALSSHQLKIRIKIRNFQECVAYDGNIEPVEKNMEHCFLLADYYLLTREEKENFKSEELVYLIEEYQTDIHNISSNSVSNRYTLNIDRAIKELIIIFRDNESEANNDWFNYGLRDPLRQGLEFIKSLEMYMNGKTRFEKISESYYRLVTPQKYHTFAGNRNIYSIPFAERPEIDQPTGSINLTMYSNSELGIDYSPNIPESKMFIFGISYNVLVIKDGLAQVKFLS
jgi:hypothetical protein